ncbi:hypothetical protein N7G274_009138 [Stereocaulon virgatum]|uniref:Uncharacterized protein n=1 Tax=Stereocaulon virgatum TaxID=373712 RepID=A0ABR3ZZF3_9LECA
MTQTVSLDHGPNFLEGDRLSFYEEHQASIDRSAKGRSDSVRLCVGLSDRPSPKDQPQQGASAAQIVADQANELVRRQLALRNKRPSRKSLPQQAASSIPTPKRGTSPYCAYRKIKKGHKPYRTPTAGQYCECPGATDHPETLPSDWASTPAEAEWDYSLPNGGWHQRKRVVRFVEPVVTESHKVDKWVVEAYGAYVGMSAEEMQRVSEEEDEAEEWLEEADGVMGAAIRAWGERRGKRGGEENEEDEDEMEWWDGDEMELLVDDAEEEGDWVVVEGEDMVVH